MNYKHKVSSASLLQDKFDIWTALWITTRNAMTREYKLPIKKINKKYSKSLSQGLLKTLYHQKLMFFQLLLKLYYPPKNHEIIFWAKVFQYNFQYYLYTDFLYELVIQKTKNSL